MPSVFGDTLADENFSPLVFHFEIYCSEFVVKKCQYKVNAVSFNSCVR